MHDRTGNRPNGKVSGKLARRTIDVDLLFLLLGTVVYGSQSLIGRRTRCDLTFIFLFTRVLISRRRSHVGWTGIA
jgi:hypothetical protein